MKAYTRDHGRRTWAFVEAETWADDLLIARLDEALNDGDPAVRLTQMLDLLDRFDSGAPTTIAAFSSAGGKAAADAMTPEERTARAKKAAEARWRKKQETK